MWLLAIPDAQGSGKYEMKGPIQRFEDFVAWQKARALTARGYQMTATGAVSHDFALRDQMRLACVSIMSNIAEGFERGRPGEFHQFLSVAKGSCAEMRAQLYVALDATYLDRETFEQLFDQADEVARLVGGLRAAVERRRDN